MTIRLKGLRPDDPDERDLMIGTLMPLGESLPGSVDLRGLVAPVVNQGSLGSCGACVAALLYATEKHSSPRSRLQIYWDARNREGTTDVDMGVTMRSVFKTLVHNGAAQEGIWPYDESRVYTPPSQGAVFDAVLNRATSYYRLNSAEDYKNCLASGHAFGIGVWAFSSLDSELVAETGVLNFPDSEDEETGGHALTIVGYDDNFPTTEWARSVMRKKCKVPERVYYARNSWGREWGRVGDMAIDARIIENPLFSFDAWTVRTA